MAVREGSYSAPPQKVSITNGKKQVEFDTPSDFLDWLHRHPEFGADHWNWHWTTQPVDGLLTSLQAADDL
jgi:hypothetical protein